MHLRNLWLSLNLFRTVPSILALWLSPNKQLIKSDIARWLELLKIKNLNYPTWIYLHILMTNKPAFRNLFYNRIKQNYLLAKISEILHPKLPTLSILTKSPSIGTGLYIEHGFGTIIMAKEIGKNCTIFHQVTIGYEKGKCPTLGDNVRIFTGAIVIGGIKLGNNCTVGANSVVTKDVPENCTVAGVPARIIKRKESQLLNESVPGDEVS